MRLPVLLLAAALSGCGALVRTPPSPVPDVPREALGRPLAPEALREDAAFLVRTLEEVHPDLYALTDSAAARQRLDAVVAALDRPMTRLGLWRRLAPWVASLGDGHTGMRFPLPEYEAWRDGGGARFSLPVEVRGDTLRLAQEALGAAACSPLSSVNGRPAAEVVAETRAVVSGEREAYRDYQVGRSFAAWAWAAAGLEGPFTVAMASGDTLRFRGGVRDTAAAPEASARPPALLYERLSDGTGWLRAWTFSRPLAEYRAELARVFAQIRAEGTERLLVDVRENGGGNSALGDALLAHLTDRPWRTVARAEWKRSEQYGRHIKSHVAPAVRWAIPWAIVPEVGGYFRTPVGGTHVATFDEPVAPEAPEHRYSGEWAVLTGTRTFSSGTLFALAVKDHGLAPIVGEETGGEASGFGEVFTFALPNSGLGVRVSSKRFVRPNGSVAPGGVVPDVPVAVPCGASGDPVRARAVAVLRERPAAEG